MSRSHRVLKLALLKVIEIRLVNLPRTVSVAGYETKFSNASRAESIRQIFSQRSTVQWRRGDPFFFFLAGVGGRSRAS